ncbi:MAG: hypothetical protein JOZ72_04000 [Alphaproteobacteria bacterium]|nr:hypothetical protein [Alphaproteobacteria bacterium]
MRKTIWLVGALALLASGAANAEAYYPFNAADFVVPADELDASAVGQAAVHSGFFPLSESDPRIVRGREAADKIYEIWEPSSHKIATITLTRLQKGRAFQVMFVAKDPARHNEPLGGEACKKWLKFSGAMRLAFQGQRLKYKFRFPQCTP